MKNRETGARAGGSLEPPCGPISVIRALEETVAPQHLARTDKPAGLDRGGPGPGLSCMRGWWRPGCADGLQTAQPGGASKAGGPRQDGPVRVKGGQLGARPGLQEHGSDWTRHPLPAFPARSPRSAAHASCPCPLVASRPSVRTRPDPSLSTAWAHPSLQRLPTLPEFSTSAGSTCDLRWSPHHSRKRWLISSETCARSGPQAFSWRRFRGGELGTEGWCP